MLPYSMTITKGTTIHFSLKLFCDFKSWTLGVLKDVVANNYALESFGVLHRLHG